MYEYVTYILLCCALLKNSNPIESKKFCQATVCVVNIYQHRLLHETAKQNMISFALPSVFNML